MTSDQKYNAPDGPPPPAYGSDLPSTPQPVHAHQTGTSQAPSHSTDYYNASPAQPYSQPQNQQYQNSYPPPQSQYGGSQAGYPPQNPGGYYAPGPQMGYVQQGYGPPQPGYGPQGGYYQGGYQPGYRPQGQYVDERRGGGGFAEALLASLACCCCLDCLLF